MERLILRRLSSYSVIVAALSSAGFSSTSFALEKLSDTSLSKATGEGIAILPDEARFVMQGAKDGQTTQADIQNRQLDTGYVRIIPVGPLTAGQSEQGAGKADAFIYGLALSEKDGNLNSRFNSGVAGGVTWGSVTNPWLVKVERSSTPDFSGALKEINYLVIESPLKEVNVPATTAAGVDAYNLKMGLWSDVFIRDPNVAEDMTQTGNQFNVGGVDRPNRVRLQTVIDGFSANGTGLKLFQTPGGATNAGGMSTSYNHTLGLAGVIRLNTQDTSNSKEAITARGMRISSRELAGAEQGNLSTPAINGGNAPQFADNSGLYIYSPNINLVLGNIYQPLTLDVAKDGRNLILELARIPNIPSIYQKIYTDYSQKDSAYLGSTCNYQSCGTNGNAIYQGNNATHSSISIGSTRWDPATNKTTAVMDANTPGMTFKVPTSNNSFNNVDLGSSVIDGMLIQHLKITTKGL